ncbi:MAG: Mur ligase family protein [Candidatus Pacebacteria bacterium]|nr:Mur ligase family protein [Candidatus Paceibacterota bacterium]
MEQFSSKIFLWYLRVAAKIQLAKSKPKIIGIGGSAGKSSLCKILETVLKEKFRVKASQGLNTETGVPLSILNLPPKDYSLFDWARIILLIPIKLLTQWQKYDFYIVEMATEEPNDISYLLKIIKPGFATLTNISIEHSENFDPFVKKDSKNYEKAVLELIEKEESTLIKKLSADGTAILNIDDERISKLRSKTKAKVITMSLKDEKTDFYVKKIEMDFKRLKLEIINKNKTYYLNIKRPLSYAYIYTILLAIALSNACGIKTENAIKTIEKKFTLPGGRLSIFEGIKNTMLIDSTYNAQPIAVLDALDFLKIVARDKKRVAILGDMRELGKISKIEHERIAERIKETVDFTILIGPLMKKYTAPILKKNGKDYKAFNTFTDAKEFILKKIEKDDVILIKGSQNTLLLERVTEMLLKDKKNKKKLCRPKPSWEKKRQKTP